MKKRFLSFAVLLSFSIVLAAQATTSDNYYPVNFDKSQDYTRTDRYLEGVSLTDSNGNTSTVRISAPRKVYSQVDVPTLSASPGETVTATFNYIGTWMHGYVYLDRGQDGSFNTTLNSDCSIPEGSDVMSFAYVEPVQGSGNGFNSKGESLSAPNTLNPPSFVIPVDLPNGFYRMRYKVDWASIDAGGRREDGNGILKNGGAICDVRLNVHGDNCNINLVGAVGGTITLTDGTAIKNYAHPFGTPLTLKVKAADGYICDAIEFMHGYNFDGDSLRCGVPQYVNSILPGYLISDGNVEVPAEFLDGDVRIKARFVKVSNDGGNDDYALSFNADKPIENTAYKLQTLSFTTSTSGTKDITIPNEASLYTNMSTTELGLQAGAIVDGNIIAAAEGLHYYMYIDFNNDGKFTVLFGEDSNNSISNELVSYTCYQGKNSAGEPVTTSASSLPSFTISPMLPSGVYRVRLKADKDNISPAGSSEIVSNGGMIVDFLLNIHNSEHPLTINTINGNVYALTGGALPMNITPFEDITVKAVGAAEGYVPTVIRVRHGHNFDGPQYIKGNRQWSQFFSDKTTFKIPADSVNGDVEIAAYFEAGEDAEYRLVFSDEFNAESYSQPVDEKWMRCQRYSSTWNRWLSDSEEVIYLKDGNLVARAIPNPDIEKDNVPMITGGIKSYKRFGFTYGYVECRILTNPYSGNFPAFWMMPENQADGWPDCGEIDIWEAIDAQNHTWHTIHSNWTYDLGNKNNPRSSYDVALDLSRYHTYGLEWNENTLIWYVDGREIGRYAKSNVQSYLDKGQWPFDKHFHLILNQSVGDGSWAAPADVTHTYETLFDWVRVYQKEGMENTNGTVGVGVVEQKKEIDVITVENGILVYVQQPSDIIVYDISGRIVKRAMVEDTITFMLPKGFYVVEGVKVIVK